MKHKTYQTVQPKKKSNVIHLHITVDPIARNELHFEVQLKTRTHVYQDKRKRKPKYKNKYEDF